MKKNRGILIVTLLLAIAAAFLIYRNKKGTIQKELQDFAVSDTASVTKIFLADKKYNSVTLEKKDGHTWTINGKYNAKKESVSLLLETIKRLAVKTRVAKAAYKGVISDLAANGIKCEIYERGETVPSKVYYVGGSTADVLGTFMLLENSSLPFVIEIPGFQGYLTPRFSPFERDWRETTVFDYQPEDIKNITITYSYEPEKSFSIEHSGGRYKVFSPMTKQEIHAVDTIGLINYFSYFKYLCFEGWDGDYTAFQRDSLKATSPINVTSITDMKGVTKTMTAFPKPVTARSLAQSDSLGNPLKYDIDRMFAFVNDGKDFVVIQYYVFGKIFRQLEDFDLDKKRTGRK